MMFFFGFQPCNTQWGIRSNGHVEKACTTIVQHAAQQCTHILLKCFFNISLQQEQNTTQHNTAQHAGSLPAQHGNGQKAAQPKASAKCN